MADDFKSEFQAGHALQKHALLGQLLAAVEKAGWSS